MIPKEQVAHDLAIAYINNKYGVDVTGDFDVRSSGGGSFSDSDRITDVYGSGSVSTQHFPAVDEPKMIKVGTGQKGFLGIEKKQPVQSGYLVDDIFRDMIKDYYAAYSRFLEILNSAINL